MQCILIPVDFSIPCYNAYCYGLQLASATGRNVVLTHYRSESLIPSEYLQTNGGSEFPDSFLLRLKQFAYPAGHSPEIPLVDIPDNVSISYECRSVLSPANAIINRALEDDIDIVVMATRSSRAPLKDWLGSTSTRVSEYCDRPVFLVPPAARYTPYKRIVVANHHETAEPYPLWQIEGLADLFGAKVHFVHVEHPKTSSVVRFVPWRLMEELIDKAPEATYPFSFVSVDKEDVAEGLLEFANEINADLVVVVNRLRHRWGPIIQSSLTKNLALYSQQPILVLHP